METTKEMRCVRILLVDDHPVVRKGLASMIHQEADMTVVGDVGSAPEALKLMEELAPDLAVIDLTLKDGHGLDLIRVARQRFPALKLLAVSMHDEAVFAERVLHSGGQGYLNKETSLDNIVGAIRKVMGGETYLSPELAERLHLQRRRSGSGRAEPPTGVSILSDRELSVFEMIGHGLTTKQIAERLSLSHKTVETHRERIKKKLGLENGPALVKRAVEWVVQSREGSVPLSLPPVDTASSEITESDTLVSQD